MTPTSDVRLPLPEDRASIQQSLSIVFDALLCSRIDNKKAAQLLWGLQIASGTIPRDSHPDPETVESFTRAKNGEELAPVCRICSELDDCDECKYARTCPKYDGTEWVEVEDEESDDEEETDEEESDDEESGSDLDNKENGSNEPGN